VVAIVGLPASATWPSSCAEEEVEEKRLQDVVAVVAERDLGRATSRATR